MTDREKLLRIATWFDLRDFERDNPGTEVQDDLRRIAYQLDAAEELIEAQHEMLGYIKSEGRSDDRPRLVDYQGYRAKYPDALATVTI